MKLLSQKQIPVFNLLSLGQRGVGKTVFLSGIYGELRGDNGQIFSEKYRLECYQNQDQENLQGILDYVAQTGKYPPPTLKITNFNFRVQKRSRWKKAMTTFCQVRWWDIPGETCNFSHPDFQKMVLDSHSCCIFINGYRLATDSSYLETLEDIIKQVMAIASVINQKTLNYSFALIFTQCDRFNSQTMSQLQIEENLQPLISSLKGVNAQYKRFYSGISIVADQGQFRLEASGSEAPLLWLVSRLYERHSFESTKTLGTVITEDSPSPWRVLPRSTQILILSTLSSLGLLIVTGAVLFSLNKLTNSAREAQVIDPLIKQHLEILEQDPNHVQTLVSLANHYLEIRHLDEAIKVMEKIVEIRPKGITWQLNLAQLYELNYDKEKAESVYDRILVQDRNNFKALVNKALLRREQGDEPTAQTFFQKAEQASPNREAKDKVRQLAQEIEQN